MATIIPSLNKSKWEKLELEWGIEVMILNTMCVKFEEGKPI